MQGGGARRRDGSPASAVGRPRPKLATPRRTERDTLRRALSQNFLRDDGADAFVELLSSDRQLLTVEVGAGEGILTKRLARRYDHLVAYEVDPFFADRLRPKIDRLANVRLVVADFLASLPPDEPFQLVGNVPFSVTSPIVDWCLGAPTMTFATIITQLEYTLKRTGGYGRWSLLTILTWPMFDWQMLGRIRRVQFRPVPRVDAGVLHLARRAKPLLPSSTMGAYRRMVELGFTGIGGSLAASLRRAYSKAQVAEAFRTAQLDPAVVVAFVSPEQWLDLFAVLGPHAAGNARNRPRVAGNAPNRPPRAPRR